MPPHPTSTTTPRPAWTLPELPISLDSRIVEIPSGGDPSLVAASTALGVGRAAAERIASTNSKIFADITRTVPAQHLAAFEAAHLIAKPAFEKLDATKMRLTSEIDEIRKKITTPRIPTPSLGAEIRAALRGMDAKARRAALMQALADESGSQDDVLGAALCAPPMLSGLSQTEVAGLKLEFAGRRFPKELKRISELEKASDHLMRGGKLLMNYLLKSYDGLLVEEAKRFSSAAQSAISSIGGMTH